MMLVETAPDHWVARDTPRAPARGFVTAKVVADATVYHAESYHIVREKRTDLGAHPTPEAALAAIVAFTADSSRSR
ncbi:hypothetical protein HQQ80_12055 [Microbacteriaceae bacterium VKM Ac-2855]|nr:hypothetical protein [Microbacteriaceae bacterium VKM Ac-2855]